MLRSTGAADAGWDARDIARRIIVNTAHPITEAKVREEASEPIVSVVNQIGSTSGQGCTVGAVRSDEAGTPCFL